MGCGGGGASPLPAAAGGGGRATEGDGTDPKGGAWGAGADGLDWAKPLEDGSGSPHQSMPPRTDEQTFLRERVNCRFASVRVCTIRPMLFHMLQMECMIDCLCV